MIILLMGVAGSGKTTVGKQLAAELSWEFIDADDFHPAENVKKMASGIPLTDEDRIPWLTLLNARLIEMHSKGINVVLACSALKEAYRIILSSNIPDFRTVHLKGEYKLIEQRMQSRTGHYMKPNLLQSQFETLEEPQGDVSVDVGRTPSMIVARIRLAFGI